MRLPDFEEVVEFIRRKLDKTYAAERRLEEQWHTTAKLLTYNPQTKKTLVELEDEIENLEAWRLEDAGSIGYPKFSTDTVIAYFHADIQKVLDVSGLTAERQQTHIIATIRRLTDLIHLIPASRQYHHRECGGLLLHSLEVAYRANQIARNRYFESSDDINDKSALQLKWILACTLGGLCHDAGKVLTDCVIRPNRNGKRYEPYSGSLVDWMMRTKEMTYHVTWVAKGTEHEDALGSLFRDLISRETREYLGGRISEELCLYFEHRLSKENTLNSVITEADSRSVAENQQAGSFNRAPVGTELDRESENFIAAFRRLLYIGAHSRDDNGVIQPVDRNGISIKGWSVNEPNSEVWFCIAEDSESKRPVKRLFIATSALMDIRSIYAAFNVTSTLYHEKRVRDDMPRAADESSDKDKGLNPKNFRVEEAAKESLREEEERAQADIREEQEMDLLNLLEELHKSGFIEICPRKGEDAFVPEYRRFYWTISQFFASDPDGAAQNHKPFRAICFSEKAINLLFVNENDVPKSADGYNLFNENKEYRLTEHVSPSVAVKDAKNEDNRKAAEAEQIAGPGEVKKAPSSSGSAEIPQNAQEGNGAPAGIAVNPLEAALKAISESKSNKSRNQPQNNRELQNKADACLPKSVLIARERREKEKKQEKQEQNTAGSKEAKTQSQTQPQPQTQTKAENVSKPAIQNPTAAPAVPVQNLVQKQEAAKPKEQAETKEPKEADKPEEGKDADSEKKTPQPQGQNQGQTEPKPMSAKQAKKAKIAAQAILMPSGQAFAKGLNKGQKEQKHSESGKNSSNANTAASSGAGQSQNHQNAAQKQQQAKQTETKGSAPAQQVQQNKQNSAGNNGNAKATPNTGNASGSGKKKKKKNGKNAQNAQNQQNEQKKPNNQNNQNQGKKSQNKPNNNGQNGGNGKQQAQQNPQKQPNQQQKQPQSQAQTQDKNQNQGQKNGKQPNPATPAKSEQAKPAISEQKQEKQVPQEPKKQPAPAVPNVPASNSAVTEPKEDPKPAKTEAAGAAEAAKPALLPAPSPVPATAAPAPVAPVAPDEILGEGDEPEDMEAYLRAAISGDIVDLGDEEDGELEELEELEESDETDKTEGSENSETPGEEEKNPGEADQAPDKVQDETADAENETEITESDRSVSETETAGTENAETATAALTEDKEAEDDAEGEEVEAAEEEEEEPEYRGDPWSIELTDRLSGVRWTVLFDGEGRSDGWIAEAEVPFGVPYVFEDDPRVTVRQADPFKPTEKPAESAPILLSGNPEAIEAATEAEPTEQAETNDNVIAEGDVFHPDVIVGKQPAENKENPLPQKDAEKNTDRKTEAKDAPSVPENPSVPLLPYFRQGMPKLTKKEFIRKLRSEFASTTPEIAFTVQNGIRTLPADTFNDLLRKSGLSMSEAGEAISNSWRGIVYDDATNAFHAAEIEDEDDEDDGV